MKVLMIAAATLDGRIGPGVIGSPQDRLFLEKMRARTDASLLGAGTLREGDPELRGPDGALPAGRIRAIISGSANIVCEKRKIFLHGPPPLIFTAEENRAGLVEKFGPRAEIVALPRGTTGLSIRAALDELGRRDAQSVLVEGGGKLNYACLLEGVVDEILLTITPKLSGDRAAATLINGPGPLGAPFLDLDLLECDKADTGEIFCRYRVLKKV